jgi:signal peptidase
LTDLVSKGICSMAKPRLTVQAISLMAGFAVGAIVAGAAGVAAQEVLFKSAEVTPAGEYTSGIEGPAVDADGNL